MKGFSNWFLNSIKPCVWYNPTTLLRFSWLSGTALQPLCRNCTEHCGTLWIQNTPLRLWARCWVSILGVEDEGKGTVCASPVCWQELAHNPLRPLGGSRGRYGNSALLSLISIFISFFSAECFSGNPSLTSSGTPTPLPSRLLWSNDLESVTTIQRF